MELWKRALAGLALGTLAALLIAPQTRSLVRVQMAMTLGLYHPFGNTSTGWTYTGSAHHDRERERAVAESNPNDYLIQYAAASSGVSSSAGQLQNLRDLTRRFPNTPSLYANILRNATRGSVHFNRKESDLLIGQAKHFDDHRPPSTPEALAAFDQDAAAGERLDPDNAYFPFMRAAGLYAAHKDAEARAAIHRAGAKSQWNEYFTDEAHAFWSLHEKAFGDDTALWHVSEAASILLPHYVGLRNAARVAAYQAMQDEQAGRVDEGVSLRRDLMRCGSLMRAQSTLTIGSMVGIAIANTAMKRPGGAPYHNSPPQKGPIGEANSQADLETYCAYLQRAGHGGDIPAARAEFEAGRQVDAVSSRIWGGSMSPRESDVSPFGKPLTQLFRGWIATLIVLANALWTLIFGGLALLLTRLPIVRDAHPLPLWARLSLLATLVLSLLALGPTLADTPGTDGLVTVTIILGLIATSISAIFLRRHRRAIGRGLALCAAAYTALCLLFALVGWQARGIWSVIGFSHSWDSGGISDSVTRGQVHGESIASALAAPLLALLVLAVASLVRRVPLAAGMAQGLRRAALPLACLLVLAYGGLILGLARQESRINGSLMRQMQGEGRYLAELTHQTWPDAGKTIP